MKRLFLIFLFVALAVGSAQAQTSTSTPLPTATPTATATPTWYTFNYDFSEGMPYTSPEGIQVEFGGAPGTSPIGTVDSSIGNPAPSGKSGWDGTTYWEIDVSVIFPYDITPNTVVFDRYEATGGNAAYQFWIFNNAGSQLDEWHAIETASPIWRSYTSGYLGGYTPARKITFRVGRNSSSGEIDSWMDNISIAYQWVNPLPTATASPTPTATPEWPVASFTANPVSGTVPLTVNFWDTSTGFPTSWGWDFGDGTYSGQQDPTHTYTAVGDYTVHFTAANNAGFTRASTVISVTDGSGSGTGTLTRPLAIDDENQDFKVFDLQATFDRASVSETNYPFYPILRTFSPYAVYGVSNAPGAMVHSAAPGTVTSLRPLVSGDCGTGTVYFTDPYTFPTVYDTTASDCLVALFSLDGFPIATGFNTTNAYIVKVDDGNETFTYVVANAPQYITVGDTVGAGCILGETLVIDDYPGWASIQIGISIDPVFISDGNTINLGAIDINNGFTVFEADSDADGTPLAVIDDVTIYSDNNHPCNLSGEFSSCLSANPRLSGGGTGWDQSGSITFTEPGATLAPNAILTQPLNLDPYTDYTLTAQVTATADNAPVRLSLGYSSQNFTVTGTQNISVDLASGSTPDSGLEYTELIQNTGSSDLYVAYLCVTAGAPDTARGECYFNNPLFENGATDWTVTGTYESRDDGTLALGDGAALAQSASLAPGDYTLNVTVYPWVDPPDTNVTGTISLAYRFPSTGSDVTLGTISLAGDNLGSAYAFTTTITVAAQTDSDLVFTVTVGGGSDAKIKGLLFDRACLTVPISGTGGVAPPVPYTCNQIVRPTTSEVYRWIEYEWQQLDRFFECDLMVLLNRLYQMIDGARLTIAWSIRYGMSFTYEATQWADQTLFPYLSGNFANMAYGRTTIITDSGGGCHDVFCLLDSLIQNLLSPLVDSIHQLADVIIGFINRGGNLILDLATALVGLIIQLLAQVLKLFQLGRDLLATLITAYNNATPTPIPGAPDCSDYTSSGFCQGIWVADNTIFSGTGSVVIPILIGILSIHLMLWVVGRLKSTISEFSNA